MYNKVYIFKSHSISISLRFSVAAFTPAWPACPNRRRGGGSAAEKRRARPVPKACRTGEKRPCAKKSAGGEGNFQITLAKQGFL